MMDDLKIFECEEFGKVKVNKCRRRNLFFGVRYGKSSWI